MKTREHWIQCITFAAETSVLCSRRTHMTAWHQVTQYLRSLSGSKGNKKSIAMQWIKYEIPYQLFSVNFFGYRQFQNASWPSTNNDTVQLCNYLQCTAQQSQITVNRQIPFQTDSECILLAFQSRFDSVPVFYTTLAQSASSLSEKVK